MRVRHQSDDKNVHSGTNLFLQRRFRICAFFASMLLGQARDKTWDDNKVRVVGHK